MMVVPEDVPIAFVDDDEIDRMVLAAVFERSKLRNETVFLNDGRAAIDYLETAAAGENPIPGLVFVDVNMPGLNGFEVLRHVKTMTQFQERPAIVMLTSSEAAEDRTRAAALGADGYLPKQSGLAKFVDIFNKNFTNDPTSSSVSQDLGDGEQ